jgi:hypothetical protein
VCGKRGRIGDVDGGRTSRVHGFRKAEVEHLDGAVAAHFDICRLQVAVDDPLLVRGFQRLRDLPRDGQGFVERHGSTRDVLRQIVPFDELHH